MPSSPLDRPMPPPPQIDALSVRYADLERRLAVARTDAAWTATLGEWDGLRRQVETWASLTQLRFDQDTTDAAARSAREQKDELIPKLTALDHALKRRFVSDGTRLTPALGPQAFRLWEHDLAAFAPEVEDDLIEESRLAAAYTSTIASIEVAFRGETLNLAALQRFASDPDRSVRHDAAAARWRALGERGAEIDGIFDALVHVRHRIAQKLGYRSFTELGYRRMQRVGYGPDDVARWRDAIVAEVVPAVAALMARAAPQLGVDRIALWDEKFLTGPERPAALGDAQWLLQHTIDGLGAISPQLGAFVAMVERERLNDLMTRPGKAGGAHCTFFPSLDVPFVFANCNGTRDDVRTLMHELGHAYQSWSSRAQPVLDYLWPTHEAAEIHSMSLEYLSWPAMGRFFGAEADAYRQAHIAESLAFLPYGVAIDHFQHLVYERPDATPTERNAMWRWCEERYLPWRSYGDLERPTAGAYWQAQLHIFKVPFYYVDYTLALCCALQFWAASYDDPEATMQRYLHLCARGGSASFIELAASAGLRSPFGGEALGAVVTRAREALAL